jgi:hypothetical protein
MLVFVLFLIPPLLVACGSTGTGGGSGSPGDGELEPIPESVPRITGQKVRVEWKNLNPRRNDPPLGLINSSSPTVAELYRRPDLDQHVKPVDDEKMAVILEAFKQVDFYEFATEGVTLDSLRMGDAHGAVYVRQGDRHHTLVFRPGQGGTGLPQVYRDCKQIIIEFHRRTYWPRPTKTNQDPSRVFQIPSGRPRAR